MVKGSGWSSFWRRWGAASLLVACLGSAPLGAQTPSAPPAGGATPAVKAPAATKAESGAAQAKGAAEERSSQVEAPAAQPKTKEAPVIKRKGKVWQPPSPEVRKLITEASRSIRHAAFDQAIAQMEEAAKLAPERPELWLFLAELRQKVRLHSEAAQAFGRCLELRPDDKAIKRQYAKALYEAAQYAQANKVWGELLAINPHSLEALHYRARCTYYLKDYPQTEKLLAEALREQPEYPPVRALEVKLSTAEGRYWQAYRQLQELRSLLESGHPSLLEAESCEEEIRWGLLSWVGAGVLGVLVLGGGVYAYRRRQKAPQSPAKEKESLS